MEFKDLQRFFSGEFTDREKTDLFNLFQKTKGKKILAIALEEGWNMSANRIESNWDSELCYNKILKKINMDFT
ncbi:MAG: hypothetical protein KAS71_11135 [Bacteroidales bacterium]|nr:hypothetical protein [Bacteroidales bacterium]